MKPQVKKVMSTLKQKAPNTMLGNFVGKYDAFKMLIGTILSARSRDEVTEVIAEDLFKKYPTVSKLANAKQADVEKIIKKIGFYRNKAKMVITCAQQLRDEFNSKVPDNLDDLMKLSGVGRKVGNCVLVYAFKQDAIPVDIHVHRISNRLGWVKTTDPDKTEFELYKLVPKSLWQDVNDYLVSHGKTVCKPITPQCGSCSISKYCSKVDVK